MKTRSGIMLAALLLAAVSAGAAPAADKNPQYEGVPSYSVTRLKIFEGSVWVRTPDSGEWEEFRNNSPVPERARISVPEDSEAELQFHGGQFMLLTGGTELDLQRIEDGISVFRIRSGEIRFDLPEEDFSPVRVLVPGDARVDLPVPGKYWLTAPEGEDPRLVVRAGEATVYTDRGESSVGRGEGARIGRDVDVGPYAGGPVEERREEPRLSEEERQAGVPPAAATELRQYGEWVYSSDYGYVWRPRVAPGWTPYYYGQWVWISPYGWTWISAEPWGWYPYHYGYWYTDPLFGWVWYPFRSFVSVNFVFGSYRYRHFHRRVYFVPATVRFVGYGSSVRWVPLRPGERVRRVRFTRSDRRLVGWDRTLPPRTIYVRREGPKGREWREWEAAGKRTGAPGGRDVSPARERVRDRTDRPSNRRMERTRGPRVRAGSGERAAVRKYRADGEKREEVRESPVRAVRPERVSAPPRGGNPPPRTPVRGKERTVSPRVGRDAARGQTRAEPPGVSTRPGVPRGGAGPERIGVGGGWGDRGGGSRGVR